MSPKRNRSKTKKNGSFYVMLTIFLFGGGLLVFGNMGLKTLWELRAKKTALTENIAYLKNKHTELVEAKKQLFDDEYLEALARERYRMVKPGEKVFRVIDRRKIKLKN
jgi:cell division protein FtsB